MVVSSIYIPIYISTGPLLAVSPSPPARDPRRAADVAVPKAPVWQRVRQLLGMSSNQSKVRSPSQLEGQGDPAREDAEKFVVDKRASS